MEINIPTASPFFTGISNQIMYCISTPNLPAAWNAAGSAYSTEQQKKPENAPIIQPVANPQNTQAQYYYGNSNTAITQNVQPFNQTYPPANIQQSASNEVSKTNNSGNYAENNDQNKSQQERENRFFNEDGRAYECAVVSLLYNFQKYFDKIKNFNFSARRNFAKKELSYSMRGFIWI